MSRPLLTKWLFDLLQNVTNSICVRFFKHITQFFISFSISVTNGRSVKCGFKMTSEMKNISKASIAKPSKGQDSMNGRNGSKAIKNPVGTKTDARIANKKSPLTATQIPTESKRSSVQKNTTRKTTETSTAPAETGSSLITKSKAKQIQSVSSNKEAKIITLQKIANEKTTPRSTTPPPCARKSGWIPRTTSKRITTLTVIIVCFIVAILIITFIYALVDVKPEIVNRLL